MHELLNVIGLKLNTIFWSQTNLPGLSIMCTKIPIKHVYQDTQCACFWRYQMCMNTKIPNTHVYQDTPTRMGKKIPNVMRKKIPFVRAYQDTHHMHRQTCQVYPALKFWLQVQLLHLRNTKILCTFCWYPPLNMQALRTMLWLRKIKILRFGNFLVMYLLTLFKMRKWLMSILMIEFSECTLDADSYSTL